MKFEQIKDAPESKWLSKLKSQIEGGADKKLPEKNHEKLQLCDELQEAISKVADRALEEELLKMHDLLENYSNGQDNISTLELIGLISEISKR